MSGEAIAPRIAGTGGITVLPDGTIDGTGVGGPTVTAFQMVNMPGGVTSSAAPVDLISIPVIVTTAGNILVDFDASVDITPPPAAVVPQGAFFQITWDGVMQPDSSGFFEIDPGAAGTVFDTFAMIARVRSLIVGATVGAHTLAVQWGVFDALSVATIFATNGNLSVQTAR